MEPNGRFGSSASHRHARDMSAVLLIAAELMRNSNLSRLANRRRFRFDERTTGNVPAVVELGMEALPTLSR